MRANSLCRITAAVVVVLVAGALTVTTRAAKTETRDRHDLSHFVPFKVGQTWLRDGDRITIEEIHGTSDAIAVGNLYEIKGTYTLASHQRASLSVDITSSDPRHFPSMETQSVTVDQGDGHFTIYMYMWCEGSPHVSFYPKRAGSSFASVYFGTENAKDAGR
jgi:hypothetical protein